ncbi:LptE family protein [Chitinophaga nivalis]|uniref:LPS assembly lipoprotein LptE n=1 Tax=Chitinophaga nivalis TaxID=2991709 RepID=A0ABT3IQJ0_9BACT|nr:LptE family protein [Chitinophaga nivalis]MCW3464070.1 LPS assembly lipoprotein LptE [Chitinophaga nivalis]MCW3486240.1 LPS assembly lipoprotein LptE [Chitinophaga nivalis]
MIKTIYVCIALAVLAVWSGCSVNYSMTGASIDQGASTVNVRFIENRAPITNPTFSQKLTQKLRDKIQSQTRLTQVNENESKADYEFRGTITGYSFSNAAVTNVDQAATSRLNVTVNITFIKRIGDKKGFTQSFTRSADFSANQLPSSVENGLLDNNIIPGIVDDIFNRAYANW